MGVLHEGDHVGVVERHAIAGLAVPLLGREPVDVGVRQAVELGARHDDRVLVLVDVAAEGDAQLHQALLQVAQAAAARRVQRHPVAAEVAQAEVQEARRLRLRRPVLGGAVERAQGGVELLAKAQPGREGVQLLLGRVRGLAQGGVGRDLGEEAVAPAGLHQQVADLVHGVQRVLDAAAGVGHGGDLAHERFRAHDRRVDARLHVGGRDRRVVEGDGVFGVHRVPLRGAPGGNLGGAVGKQATSGPRRRSTALGSACPAAPVSPGVRKADPP